MTQTVRPAGRNRKATASSLTLTAGLLSLCYWGCAPDFGELNAGSGGGRGGAGANGGASARGGADNEGGGASLGGRPECGDSGCAGGMSEGGSAPISGGTSGHSGASGDAGRGADAGAGGDVSLPQGGDGGGAGDGGSSPGEGGDGGGGTVVPEPTIRWDFEKSLQGWSGVTEPIPADCVDSITVSKDAAHNGEAALALTFDGQYTPDPSSRNPYYGAISSSAPPPGSQVTVWMMATAPGVAAEWFTQLAPFYDWVQLTPPTSSVGVDLWTEFTFTMPPTAVLGFGVKVYTPLNFTGAIYLDHVSW